MYPSFLVNAKRSLLSLAAALLCFFSVAEMSAQIPLACTPDCPQTPFNGPFTWNVGITIPPCPSPVTFEVTFWTRHACNIWWDVQITGIRSIGGVYSECSGVRIFPEQYFAAILREIMEHPSNPTGFPPFNPGDCETQWRVSVGACQRVVGINPGPGESWWKMEMLNCDETVCCLTPFTVCMNPDGSKTATANGGSVGGSDCPPADPTFVPEDPNWDGLSRPCQDVCGWSSWGLTKSGARLPIEFDNSGLTIAPNPAQQSVQMDFDSGLAGNAQIVVVDARGSQVARLAHTIVAGSNSLNIDVSEMPASTYTVQVLLDGKVLTQGRFAVTR